MFGAKRSFDLAAGVFCKPLVKEIFKRYKVRKSLFSILIFCHSNIADLLFWEDELQIVVHHHVFTAKTTQILGDNAVDFAGFHILHHLLKSRTLKVGAAPSIIHILGKNLQAMFDGILSKNGTLCFNADAVAVILIITAETHIQCSVIYFGVAGLFHSLSSFA